MTTNSLQGTTDPPAPPGTGTPSPGRLRASKRRVGLLAIIATLALAAFALVGCGGSSESGVANAEGGSTGATGATTSTTASEDAEQAQLNFARCMREQGLDFPDPQPDANGNLRFRPPARGPGADQSKVEAARKECQPLLNGAVFGGGSPADQSEFRDALLEFARCMRGEGIDVPDPDPNAAGPQGFFRLDRNDPKVQAASDTCGPIIRDALDRARGGS